MTIIDYENIKEIATFTDSQGNSTNTSIPGVNTPKINAKTSVYNIPVPEATGTDIVGWVKNLTFASTVYNIVTWSSGTITLGNGTTYTISVGDTGAMAQITYIYLTLSTSTISVTTTAINSVGTDKILICVAKPTVSGKIAQFQAFGTSDQSVFITADNIAANSITANEIRANTITANKMAANSITIGNTDGSIESPTGAQTKVNTLAGTLGSLAYDNLVELAKLGSTVIVGGYIKTSLLTADNIVTGTLTGRTVQTASSGARIELTSTTGLRSFDSGSNVRLRMPTDGTGITFFTSAGVSTNRLQGGVIGTGAWAGKRVLNIDNNGVAGDGNLLVDNDCGIVGTLWASGKMRLPVGTNLY